jgi:hypothetical protein
MITKLLPGDISEYWDIISYGLDRSLPPVANGTERMNNILASLLAGSMDCWIGSEGDKIVGMMITAVSEDVCSGTRDLIIYALYGYNRLPGELWVKGYSLLSRYAKSKNCGRITAYTNVSSLIEISKRFGASTEYTYITVPLDSD